MSTAAPPPSAPKASRLFLAADLALILSPLWIVAWGFMAQRSGGFGFWMGFGPLGVLAAIVVVSLLMSLLAPASPGVLPRPARWLSLVLSLSLVGGLCFGYLPHTRASVSATMSSWRVRTLP